MTLTNSIRIMHVPVTSTERGVGSQNSCRALTESRAGRWLIFLSILGILALCERAHGMATEQIGPNTSNRPIVVQPGWLKGIVEPLRHSSRVYSIWVNGNENFYFKTNPDEANELINLFSKARLRDHEVWIEPGTNSVKSFGGTVFDYNVSIQILSGIALFMSREQDTAETLEPRLTIYVGEDPSVLKQLKLPDNVTVRSKIEGVDIKGKLTKPSRKIWFGCVQFDDSTNAVDLEHSSSTQISLWDRDFQDCIPLATVNRDGILRAVFSDDELADLKSGKSWLTVTVGNFLTEPKKTDARFPGALLTLDKEKANPHKISRPQYYYYGRILFEDGSPPVLDPKPWPGAEINLDFAYAGRATLDAKGYFTVFLEPEQFAKLKAEKLRKNIYCPTDKQGQSSATDAFPPELLSQDKAKAGVVRIAKPAYMNGKKP